MDRKKDENKNTRASDSLMNDLLNPTILFHAKPQRKRKGARKIALCVFAFSLRLCVKQNLT
jgi:hypothetical protein